MRILMRAIYVSAWLFTSTLCEEHVHANYHDRRGLSDILAEIAGAQPGENAALASQLEAIATASSVPTGDGVVTFTLGGNEAKSSAIPSNQGAIWVSLSTTSQGASPSPEASQSTTRREGGNGNSAQPSVQEPSTTLKSTPSGGAPFPSNGTIPGQAAAPIEGVSTTTMTHTTTLWSTVTAPVPATSQPAGVSPPASILPGVLPTRVQSGMAIGTGIIQNGACNCACNCPVGAFPNAQPALPAPIAANGTTLQTVILPPTSTGVLPSTLLIDTSRPPNPALSTAPIVSQNPSPIASAPIVSSPIVSAPASVLPTVTPTPAAAPIRTTPLPVIAPTQSAIAIVSSAPAVSSVQPPASLPSVAAPTGPDSTLQLGLTTGALLPTAVAELSPADPTSINISTFSLVSSLVLGPLGG